MNYRSGEAPDHLRRSAIARRTLRGGRLNVVPSAFLHDVFAAFGIQAEIIPRTSIDVEFRFGCRRPRSGRGSCRPAISRRSTTCRALLRAFRRAGRRTRRDADARRERLAGVGDAPLWPRSSGLRNVTFAGRVPPDDIWRYYAEADIYLQTPTSTTCRSRCSKRSRAAARGRHRAGGVPAILTDGLHGLLAPVTTTRPSRARDGAAARRAGARAPARRRRASTCARYQWSSGTRARWQLYRRLVRPARAGRGHGVPA